MHKISVVNSNKMNKPFDFITSSFAANLSDTYNISIRQLPDGYYFYVLSKESNGTTTLIMDRNINSDGTPTTKAIYESQKDSNRGIYNLVAYNIDGEAADAGPVTVMSFLNNATSTWSNIPNLNIIYLTLFFRCTIYVFF